MIVYQLACGREHFFEGWFASADACERQAADGQLECPVCASPDVRKLPSAPHVHTSGEAASRSQPRARVLGELRKYIVANTEDVGRRFAEIARRIHYREEEARGIRGQVTREEAVELHEEGVEVVALSPEVLPDGNVH